MRLLDSVQNSWYLFQDLPFQSSLQWQLLFLLKIHLEYVTSCRDYRLVRLVKSARFLGRQIRWDGSRITCGRKGEGTFASIIAPAWRSLEIIKASWVGVQLTIAFEPAVVGIPATSILSFTNIGTQNNGNALYNQLCSQKRKEELCERDTFWDFVRASSSFAQRVALGWMRTMEFNLLSYFWMREMYSSTTWRQVFCPRNRALWRDVIVASSKINSVELCHRKKIATEVKTTIDDRRID